jgi:spermidine dehydrogenase
MSFGEHITRRDFLNGTLVGVGSTILACGSPRQVARGGGPAPSGSVGPDWYGYGGVGDYRLSHGNTPEAVETAHQLRDGRISAEFARVTSVENFDLVIVGAGIAGLGAAFEYVKTRRPGRTCLMLDNHPIFGGEAKENEFQVNGIRLIGPQGSNGFFVPELVSDPERAEGDARYYAELGVPREFRFREWPAAEKRLRFGRDNYEHLVRGLEQHTSLGHFFGHPIVAGTWAIDMWQRRLADTPLSGTARETLLQWYASGAKRQFASEEEAIRKLDTMSYEEFLKQELQLGSEAARFADLLLASACGLGSDAVSAYKLPMPGLTEALPPDPRRASFPGGNSGFVRYFLKRLIPDSIVGSDSFEDIITGLVNLQALDQERQPLRIRLRATVVRVEHEGDPASSGAVRLVYTRGGRLYGIRAKAVIMATGGWINRHVVRDLPPEFREAYARFVHAPFLVANVALTNWRFLYRLGITAAIWDRQEGDFGYTCNIRNPMQVGHYQPPLDPTQPAILSFYTPFHRPGLPLEVQAIRGRAELLHTSYPEFERKIGAQMMKLFAAYGFDPKRDVAGLILNRWGHAFSVPFPGFFGGASGRAPRDVIRRRHGRITFAHSELAGWQHWGTAADEGRRAFSQLVGAI